MTTRRRLALVAALIGLPVVAALAARPAWPAGKAAAGPELVLPQNRSAYLASESVELAVTGPRSAEVVVELIPQKPGAVAVKFTVGAGGAAGIHALGPHALAPNIYAIRLNGKDAGKLTITTGVPRSSMLVSQSSVRPPEGGANFILGNAFSFGLLDSFGLPLVQLRGRRSAGLSAFEQAVLADLPVIVYMYWTGYVLHKPFGDEKTWAAPSMNAAMRLLSFHTAQRLRRFGKAIESVGPIDEPGLAWGRTPAGGMASGFPNWDEKGWYEARGWKFTDDPAGRPDDDWMKYLTTRCGIIKENYHQARKDIHTVWPAVTWSGDLYAPQAIMDGTDPLSQEVNQVPASHVFFDFFGGPMAVAGQIYLEKAHDPLAPLAHAMNGQLTGTPGPPRPLYHLLMNQMLAAGIASNWWLNTGKMTKDDLATVNGPAERIGPLFRAMAPRDHDLAVLWSFTEIGMREKAMTAKEARKKTGEQIKLLLPFPEKGEVKETEIVSSPYEVGGTYTRQLLDVHQVLRRAGYPGHILHEKLLPRGILKRYKTLVIVGQTFELPADVRKAITDFTAAGGTVVIDRSTTVKFDQPVVLGPDFSAVGTRARAYQIEQRSRAAKNKRDASRPAISDEYNRFHREAVAPVKAAMAKTASRPVFFSDDVDLQGERHTGGEGALLMVVNGHEKVPDLPEDQPLPTYNYTRAATTFTLHGVADGSVVYCIEGLDWRRATKLDKPRAPIQADFAPGEMKLYLVAPRQPGGLDLSAAADGGVLRLRASLKGVRMPWPLAVSMTSPDGRTLYEVYRATRDDGNYAETFPIGENASAGIYTIRLHSIVAELSAVAQVIIAPKAPVPRAIAEPARVFDGDAIRAFLASKPSVVIALGKDAQKSLADALAKQLGARGIEAAVQPEAQAVRKVAYPRVWDPYARLYKAAGKEQKAPGPVKTEVTLLLRPFGAASAETADGKPVVNWRLPNTLATVGREGYLDWLGPHEVAYEPGCKLYIDGKGQLTVLKGELTHVQTTADFRARWARPWQSLTSHVGGFQLPPQLPEAYTADSHLILLGDSTTGPAIAALQASELLPQVVDGGYPGPGRALVSFAWSPFAVEKNVILVGASDAAGLRAGVDRLLELAAK